MMSLWNSVEILTKKLVKPVSVSVTITADSFMFRWLVKCRYTDKRNGAYFSHFLYLSLPFLPASVSPLFLSSINNHPSSRDPQTWSLRGFFVGHVPIDTKKPSVTATSPAMWFAASRSRHRKYDAPSSELTTSLSSSSFSSAPAPSPQKVSIGTDINLEALRPRIISSPLGLDTNLDAASKLFIVKQRDPSAYSLNLPIEGCYKILNQSCKHVFTAVEIDPAQTRDCFLMHVYTPDLKLVLKLSALSHSKSMTQISDGAIGDHEILAKYEREIQFLQVESQLVDARHSSEEDSPQTVFVQLNNGSVLGCLLKGEAGWVIVDASVYPIYMFPFDSDDKHPTPLRGDTDIVYNFYSSGPDLMSYVGSPLGRIHAQPNDPGCNIQVDDWNCFGVNFPDHLTASDKALVLTVALSQYCRDELPRDRRQSDVNYFKCKNLSLGVCCIIFVCLSSILVGGLLAVIIYVNDSGT